MLCFILLCVTLICNFFLSGTITEHPPWVPDATRKLEKPFSLKEWIKNHKDEVKLNEALLSLMQSKLGI